MSLTTTLQTVIHDVSKFETLLPVIITGLEQNVQCFKAGNLTSFLSKWRTLTSDREILDMITGTTIDFTYLPVRHGPFESSQILSLKLFKLRSKAFKQRCDCQN